MPRALFLTSALVFLGLTGCLEPPGVGKAAAPDKADTARPIMGGSTNAVFLRKLEILNDLLDGKLKRVDVKGVLGKGLEGLPPDEREKRKKALAEAVQALPPSIGNGSRMPDGPERDMVLGRFYFAERRFIEAGDHFSKVLDIKPQYPETRNLLAKCFFFLGNPDRTIQELELRVGQLNKNAQSRQLTDGENYEYVDALFLIGAAVVETPGTSRVNLEKGLEAWERYKQLAPESPNLERVNKGLEEIRAGLRGEGRLAQSPLVAAQAGAQAPMGVKGGAASFRGGAAGPAAKKADRVKNLPADASPFDRALAAGLDALDMRQPAEAEKSLKEAEALKPGDPAVQTGIARLFVQTGRTDAGLKLYGEIIKRHPDYMPAWHYNGMAHMMNGDPGQAASSWEHIQKTDPKYFEEANLARRVQVAKRMAAGR